MTENAEQTKKGRRNPMPLEIHYDHQIDAPIEKVWEVITDLAHKVETIVNVHTVFDCFLVGFHKQRTIGGRFGKWKLQFDQLYTGVSHNFQFLPLLMTLGILYPCAVMTSYVIQEKETRARELMLMMSVTLSDIEFSWFLSFWLYHCVITATCCFLYKRKV